MPCLVVIGPQIKEKQRAGGGECAPPAYMVPKDHILNRVKTQSFPSFEYATDCRMATNRFISHIVSCLFDENCNIAATAEIWPTELFI